MLDRLLNWYSTLCPETLGDIHKVYHEVARFRDPFNDVTGSDAIRRVFEHMFEHTRMPKFDIEDVLEDGDLAWVKWVFSFYLTDEEIIVVGFSEIEFGDDGRVISHRDYWDSMELLTRLPWLGGLFRLARNRLSAAK